MAANMIPQSPIVNAGLVYIDGLHLENDATLPNSVVRVYAGQCRDLTNTNDIFVNPVYDTTVTPPVLVSNYVTVSTSFVGVGGLDKGTVAASTMYAVYAIGSSTNQPYLVNYAGANQAPIELPFSKLPGAALLSADFNEPALPSGYDMFRRIGTIVTDGASHIVEFRQTGTDAKRRMWYSAAVSVVAAGHATGYTAVSLNANAPAVPTNLQTNVVLSVAFDPTAAGDQVFFQPTGATGDYVVLSGVAAGVVQTMNVECPCNTNASISYKQTVNTDSVTYGVRAFDDLL